jgi:hypothetical protein
LKSDAILLPHAVSTDRERRSDQLHSAGLIQLFIRRIVGHFRDLMKESFHLSCGRKPNQQSPSVFPDSRKRMLYLAGRKERIARFQAESVCAVLHLHGGTWLLVPSLLSNRSQGQRCHRGLQKERLPGSSIILSSWWRKSVLPWTVPLPSTVRASATNK